MKKLLTTMAFILFFLNISFAQGTWTLQSTLTGLGDYPAISVYSPTGVVVAGGLSGKPKVFKSTDSGVNWTDITGNLTGNPEIYSLWAIDENVIYACDGGSNGGNGGNAKVWKTTNGGTNWTTILTTGGTEGFINGITFSRTMPDFGIIQSDPPLGAGQPYWIAKTTNSGNSWTITDAPGIDSSSSVLSTVKVIDSLFYGFGIYPLCKVHLTTDGGATWNLRYSGLASGYITSDFAFSTDKTYGIMASEYSLPIISRTTNGGVDWSPLNTGGHVTGYFCRMIWVYGTSTCYLTGEVGAGGTIMKSVDNGATWVTQTTAGTIMLINIDLVYVSGTVYAYAIAVNGRVIKLQEMLVGVEPINHNVSFDYKLEQNYPNPFNPTTEIKFEIPFNTNVKITVYNLMGEKVSELLNQEMTSGIHLIKWNGKDKNYMDVSSGVYFITLESSKYINTIKAVLLR
jgi:photosystem II stability/assembly factor-like uncharacterized protein